LIKRTGAPNGEFEGWMKVETGLEVLLGSDSRMTDSGLQRQILKGLGLSLCAVPS
jgi:hypothetical protein